jgi:hypothetical protein
VLPARWVKRVHAVAYRRSCKMHRVFSAARTAFPFITGFPGKVKSYIDN